MKTIKFITCTIFAMGASITVSADGCAAWGCISTISELQTTADGTIRVSTPLDETLANCTLVSGKCFTLNTSSKNAKEIYSSLLAAYISNRKIQLRIKDGHAECELSYVRFSSDY